MNWIDNRKVTILQPGLNGRWGWYVEGDGPSRFGEFVSSDAAAADCRQEMRRAAADYLNRTMAAIEAYERLLAVVDGDYRRRAGKEWQGDRRLLGAWMCAAIAKMASLAERHDLDVTAEGWIS